MYVFDISQQVLDIHNKFDIFYPQKSFAINWNNYHYYDIVLRIYTYISYYSSVYPPNMYSCLTLQWIVKLIGNNSKLTHSASATSLMTFMTGRHWSTTYFRHIPYRFLHSLQRQKISLTNNLKTLKMPKSHRNKKLDNEI